MSSEAAAAKAYVLPDFEKNLTSLGPSSAVNTPSPFFMEEARVGSAFAAMVLSRNRTFSEVCVEVRASRRFSPSTSVAVMLQSPAESAVAVPSAAEWPSLYRLTEAEAGATPEMACEADENVVGAVVITGPGGSNASATAAEAGEALPAESVATAVTELAPGLKSTLLVHAPPVALTGLPADSPPT